MTDKNSFFDTINAPMKKYAAFSMSLTNTITYGPGALLAHLIEPLAVKLGFEGGETLRMRCADAVLSILIVFVPSIIYWQYWYPTMPKYVPAIVWLIFMTFYVILAFGVLAGRYIGQKERRRIQNGVLPKDDPRRVMKDGYVYDAATSYVLVSSAWISGSVILTKMAVNEFYGLNPDWLDILVALGKTEFTTPYLAGLSSFQLPGLSYYTPHMLHAVLTGLIIAGTFRILRDQRNNKEVWGELNYNQPLTIDRENSLLTTMAGATPKWKKPVLKVALDGEAPTLLRRRAIKLVRMMQIAGFANIFLYRLQSETNADIKVRGLKAVKYLYVNSPEIFSKAMTCKHLNMVSYQLQRARLRSHSPEVIRLLKDLQMVNKRR